MLQPRRASFTMTDLELIAQACRLISGKYKTDLRELLFDLSDEILRLQAICHQEQDEEDEINQNELEAMLHSDAGDR
jgi:hypothetical protein